MFWLFECFIRPEPLLWGHGILSRSKETSVFLRLRSVSPLSPGALVKNADARAPFPTTCIRTPRWELQRIVFSRWLWAHYCLRTTETRGSERNTGLCSFTAELRANVTFSSSATWAHGQEKDNHILLFTTVIYVLYKDCVSVMQRVRQSLIQVIFVSPKLSKSTTVWEKMSQKPQSGKANALAGRCEDGGFHGLTMIWRWFCKSRQPKYREPQAATWV